VAKVFLHLAGLSEQQHVVFFTFFEGSFHVLPPD
jgi:hypothetical protein